MGNTVNSPLLQSDSQKQVLLQRTWNMRASKGNSSLSSLALLHIHYDMDVDLDEVVTRYACPFAPMARKIELDSLSAPA